MNKITDKIFKNVTKVEYSNAHGEIGFYKIISGVPDTSDFGPLTDTAANGDIIVGHSESGHHHVIEREDIEITEFAHDGMKIFHAIVKENKRLYQDASAPHEAQIIEAGEYIIGSLIDYDPFTKQARRVAD